ncbi:MAG: maltotransferase domain-containing protein, partial [Rhabdochlamydiaceae bacterium]
MSNGSNEETVREANNQPSGIGPLDSSGRMDFDLISILDVSPQVDCGRYAVKRIIGDSLRVSADILKPGHGAIIARLCHRARTESKWVQTRMTYDFDTDRWYAVFPLKELGTHVYFIEAWVDNYTSKLEDLKKWAAAGENISADLGDLIDLIKQTLSRSKREEKILVSGLLDKIRAPEDSGSILKLLSDAEFSRVVIDNIGKQGYT